MNNSKKELIESIRKNVSNGNISESVSNFYFGWNKTVAVIEVAGKNEVHMLNEKEEEMNNEELVDLLAKEYEVSKANIDFYYEGYINYSVEGRIYNLNYFDGVIGLDSIIDTLVSYINSDEFEKRIEWIIKRDSLDLDYVNSENWRDKNKTYKDEDYVSINRVKDSDNLWGLDKLYDYLEENHAKDAYKIYQLRENMKVMYIAKSKLREILKSDLPEKIKEDIEKVVSKKSNCTTCNTTYVNTLPYVYGGEQCVGREYYCPICLDLHDVKISPDYKQLNFLTGEEKMDLIDYGYSRLKEFI